MFLAAKEGSDIFWIELDGDFVAGELAAGSTNSYWRINRNHGEQVSLHPVIPRPAAIISVERIVIEANGEEVGSADTVEEDNDSA